MKEKFIQGPAPFFAGVQLSTGTQVLEALRDSLSACNWVITDNISSSNWFLAQGKYDVYDEDNTYIQTDNCWAKFTDDTAGNIVVNGDYDGTGLYLSSDFSVPYSQSNTFQLFGGFNEQAGSFIIYNNADTNPAMEGCHFGFLSDRAAMLDNTSIYIGNLGVDSWIGIEAALDFHSKLIKWKQLSNDYSNASNWKITGTAMFPYSILDYLLSATVRSGDMDNNSVSNMGYNISYGRKNAVTNRSVPLPYSMLEGLGSSTAYGKDTTIEGKNTGHDLPLRGLIQYVKSGCRKEPIGKRIIDKKNEWLLISKEVGGLALQCGRIKRIKTVLDTPIVIKAGLSDILAVYDFTNNYVLNTDYTVDYPNNSITVLSSGNIALDSIVMVSYAL